MCDIFYLRIRPDLKIYCEIAEVAHTEFGKPLAGLVFHNQGVDIYSWKLLLNMVFQLMLINVLKKWEKNI
jgi:hypothetical protein